MADLASQIVSQNGLSDVITVVKAAIEDVTELPGGERNCNCEGHACSLLMRRVQAPSTS